MENFFLLLRVVISLAAVLGLLFYLRKRLLHRFGSHSASQVTIVERHGIGPKSTVVLLDVQGRRYLLGVGESSINVLDSFEAPEPPVAVPAAFEETSAALRSQSFALSLQKVAGAPSAGAERPGAGVPAALDGGARHALPVGTAPGPLAGSVLSPDTWRRAWAALKTGRSA
ncbi:FliO/MopB family protein [Paeniglutamicibacter kerguelensis]|uniref:Flagellar protein FliO/FliZ n=1 Tax=Paeniglutamicibacter kerguelensis TaxID=254788 RepID=A0ABS4XED3_9MICC|nr:flagellar biosynthetic protein FliO [Paeniglutamicibacter kerguelensis]MBP2386842.1 flagellar protein FliO/FliZ [Paeniglutamicibacter kerguelensis]